MYAPDIAGRVIQLWLARALAIVVAHEQQLGDLDAAAGDGDHGATMVRGLRAAHETVDGQPGGPGALLLLAGDAFADAAGGASGALIGALLGAIGAGIAPPPYTTASVAAALESGLTTVMRLGKARPGDKTLVDALAPFVAALRTQPEERPLALAWALALPAAQEGAAATQAMVAARGRSARLGERSRGHADPGAVSMTYLLAAFGEMLATTCPAPEAALSA